MEIKNNTLAVQYGKVKSSRTNGTLMVFDVVNQIRELLLEASNQGVMNTKKKITIELVPNILGNEFEIRVIHRAPDIFDTLTLEQKAKGTLKGIRAAKRSDRLAKIVKWFED